MSTNPYESPLGVTVRSWQWLKKFLYISLIIAGVIVICNTVLISIARQHSPYNGMTVQETLEYMIEDALRK